MLLIYLGWMHLQGEGVSDGHDFHDERKVDRVANMTVVLLICVQRNEARKFHLSAAQSCRAVWMRTHPQLKSGSINTQFNRCSLKQGYRHFVPQRRTIRGRCGNSCVPQRKVALPRSARPSCPMRTASHDNRGAALSS